MRPKRKQKILWLTLITIVGLVGYWGYTTYQLVKERDGLIADLMRAQQKFKMLQRKYAEEKAQVAMLQRSKLALEGKLRQSQQELTAAQEEKEALVSELATVEEKFSRKIEKYEKKLARLKENRDKYKAKLAETVAIVKERNKMIRTLTAEKEELTINLQETTSSLKRCVKHNARLSQLAEELVNAYENKGIGDSLLHAEPITQLEKVEVEKLVQEYRDRIDNDNLELINPSRK